MATSNYRHLEITTISSTDLKNVNLISKPKVYAQVHISGYRTRTIRRTPTDRHGGTNPTWNCPLHFYIPEDADLSNLYLTIELNCRRRVLCDPVVGFVDVPLIDLQSEFVVEKKNVLSYYVKRPSGRDQGFLDLSYKFGDPAPLPLNVVAPPPPPPIAYPPPRHSNKKIYVISTLAAAVFVVICIIIV